MTVHGDARTWAKDWPPSSDRGPGRDVARYGVRGFRLDSLGEQPDFSSYGEASRYSNVRQVDNCNSCGSSTARGFSILFMKSPAGSDQPGTRPRPRPAPAAGPTQGREASACSAEQGSWHQSGQDQRRRQEDFRAQLIRQAFRPGPLSQVNRPQTGAFRPDFPAGQPDPVRKLWKKSGFLWKTRGGSRRRAGQPAHIFYCVKSMG